MDAWERLNSPGGHPVEALAHRVWQVRSASGSPGTGRPWEAFKALRCYDFFFLRVEFIFKIVAPLRALKLLVPRFAGRKGLGKTWKVKKEDASTRGQVWGRLF